MLNEEYRTKIEYAVKVLSSLIQQLENTPIDPRAVTLLDIAASYFEEQKENNIEYHEDEQTSVAPQINQSKDDDTSFKFLKPCDAELDFEKEATPQPQANGDEIAQEIQEWFEAGEPEDWMR